MAYFRCGGGLPTQTKSTTATTSQQIVTPDSGYVLESVTVNPQNHSLQATPTTRTSYYDLGSNHNVRYINTNSVPNSNSSYYPSSSSQILLSGSAREIDLGADNDCRYIRLQGGIVSYNHLHRTDHTSSWTGTGLVTISYGSSPVNNSGDRNLIDFFIVTFYVSTTSNSVITAMIPLGMSNAVSYYKGANYTGYDVTHSVRHWIGDRDYIRPFNIRADGYSSSYTYEIGSAISVSTGAQDNTRIILKDLYFIRTVVPPYPIP